MTREWTARLRLPAILALAGGGALVACAIHLARFPAVLGHPALPSLVQFVLVAALGGGLFAAVTRLPWRPGAPVLAGFAAAQAALFAVMLFCGRLASLSYPVATAALERRGLMAARVAPLLLRLGDGDGDGVSGWFGGIDCDDAPFDGASLVPWIDGAAPEPRLVFTELIPDRAVPRRVVGILDRDWYLMVDFALGTRELYDLATDPTAQANLPVEAPVRAAEPETALRRHMALRVRPERVALAAGPERAR